MTTECSHQLTRPSVDASSSRQVSRNVTISVAMNRPITIDSADTCVPSAAGRTMPRRISRKTMPNSTATANGVSPAR